MPTSNESQTTPAAARRRHFKAPLTTCDDRMNKKTRQLPDRRGTRQSYRPVNSANSGAPLHGPPVQCSPMRRPERRGRKLEVDSPARATPVANMPLTSPAAHTPAEVPHESREAGGRPTRGAPYNSRQQCVTGRCDAEDEREVLNIHVQHKRRQLLT